MIMIAKTGELLNCMENFNKILTKQKNQKYLDYIQNIINSNNKYAILVKIADIQDHLQTIYLIQDINVRNRLLKKI